MVRVRRGATDLDSPHIPIRLLQHNYLAGHKSMAMTKRYDHANEERYGAAIEALDAAGKTSSAEALAAARWKRTESLTGSESDRPPALRYKPTLPPP